jgi:multidrug resistance efflux pump
MSVERLVRSRRARIVLACGLIALGTWEFLPYLTHRVASSAYVNAEIVRVTAPIRGRLSAELPEKGSFIQDETAITLVEAPVADRRQIAVFEQQFAVAAAQIELAQRHLSEIEEADGRLRARAEQHRAAILSEMAAGIEEAEAEALACTIERDELGRDLALRRQLKQSGVAPARTLETAESTHGAASAQCTAAAARLERLRAERQAAENGVYLRDGNDTPYSQQQRDRLMLRRQEVEAQLLSETARVHQLEGEIAQERERILDASRYEFTLPKEHLVWSIAASPGSTVVEGQSIIDLADCTRRFVSVDLPERQAESIRRGEVAQIRLLGSTEWVTGIVERMRGSAALTDDRLYAARPSAPSERQVSVDVLLAGGTLAEDSTRQCDIGRQAEVRFDRGLPGVFALVGRAIGGEAEAGPAK